MGPLNGTIDEVRIWNVARTQAQIREDMCKKITSGHSQWSHLKGYWRFDDSADPTDDYSANSNTGDLLPADSEPSFVTSGAAIGDKSHVGTGTNNLSENADVPVDITWDAGKDPGANAIFAAIQVDGAPDVTTGLLTRFASSYWELWIANDDGAFQADVKFHYDDFSSFIGDEAELKLYTRSAAGGSWSEVSGCTINTESNNADGVGSITANNLTSFSQFIITSSGGDNPLLITLSSFTASGHDGYVLVEWETESEVENAGFNVWRSRARDGPYTRLNQALIPARGGPTTGASYSYTDHAVTNGLTYYYELEDVDIYGTSTRHGPVSATPSSATPAGSYRVFLPFISLVISGAVTLVEKQGKETRRREDEDRPPRKPYEPPRVVYCLDLDDFWMEMGPAQACSGSFGTGAPSRRRSIPSNPLKILPR